MKHFSSIHKKPFGYEQPMTCIRVRFVTYPDEPTLFPLHAIWASGTLHTNDPIHTSRHPTEVKSSFLRWQPMKQLILKSLTKWSNMEFCGLLGTKFFILLYIALFATYARFISQRLWYLFLWLCLHFLNRKMQAPGGYMWYMAGTNYAETNIIYKVGCNHRSHFSAR